MASATGHAEQTGTADEDATPALASVTERDL